MAWRLPRSRVPVWLGWLEDAEFHNAEQSSANLEHSPVSIPAAIQWKSSHPSFHYPIRPLKPAASKRRVQKAMV